MQSSSTNYVPRMNEPGVDPRHLSRDVIEHHTPDADGIQRIQHVRDAIWNAIDVFQKVVPPSADRTAAIRKLREAMMTANAAIVLGGKV